MKHINFFRLPVFMLISISISTTAAAQFSGGTGTKDNPYQIVTVADLDAVRDYTGAYFLLKNDIDLTDFLEGNTEGWLPIGDASNPFSGHFNGAGHKIEGLWINRTGTYAGLFGYNTGTISNLGVSGEIGTLSLYNVATAGTLATLVGSTNKSTLTSIVLTGSLNGDDIKFIREMAALNLISIDMSGAAIVEGGGAYDANLGRSNTTANNVIGPYMFADLKNLQTLVLPSGVTSIEQNAFGACSALTSLTIPNGVTSIGQSAMSYCRALTSITLPNSVTSIGLSAFLYCEKLAEVHVKSATPPTLGSGVFNSTPDTKKLYVPSGAKSAYRSSAWGDYFTAANIIEESSFISSSAPKLADSIEMTQVSAAAAAFSYCGGLVGYNTGSVTGCYATVDVFYPVGKSAYCGGLIGYNCGNVTGCYATGNASSSSSSVPVNALPPYCGGLIGYSSSGSIRNCYATGDVSVTTDHVASYSGGLIGYLKSGILSNSYSTGIPVSSSLDSRAGYAGALIGYNGSATISGCFYNKDVVGSMASVGNATGSANALGLTAGEMKKKSSFTSWDFYTVWAINEGSSYPYLQPGGASTGLSGTGTELDPYQIETAEDLDAVRLEAYAGKYFRLMNDIDLSAFLEGNAKGWLPIGDDNHPFTGHFDGAGHKINGLRINHNGNEPHIFIGLFGVNAGTINNLGISGGTVAGTTSGSGSVSSSGALIGRNAGAVTGCYATATVSSSSSLLVTSGGLIGYNDALGVVTNCYATGNVSSSAGSYQSVSGGLIGINDGAVTHCYVTGTPAGNGSNQMVGAVIGANEAAADVISGCYYNKDVVNMASVGSGQGSANALGLTTAEMEKKSSFTGWDFKTVWGIDEGNSYPYLRPPGSAFIALEILAGVDNYTNYNESGTYNVATAGTLATLVGTDKETLTSLTLTGKLNGDDIKFIREMATSFKLTSIDMSGAAIVAGGGYYYENPFGGGYTTTDNVIGRNMFVNLYYLKAFILPSGVTSIGIQAFSSCRALTSITIPDGVNSIGMYTFENCWALTSMTIPDGVNSIGMYAFDGCSALTEVHVKSATPPTLDGTEVFRDTPDTKKLYVPSGAKSAYQSSAWGDYFTAANIIEASSSSDITLEIPADVVYGDTILLNGSSNNPVTPIVYISSDESIAEISDNRLIAKSVGAVTITASQAAGNGYSAAEKRIDVAIGKKTLTVRADDKTRYEGEANPGFTLTYSGFVTGDDASVLDTRPQAYCEVTEVSPPG